MTTAIIDNRTLMIRRSNWGICVSTRTTAASEGAGRNYYSQACSSNTFTVCALINFPSSKSESLPLHQCRVYNRARTILQGYGREEKQEHAHKVVESETIKLNGVWIDFLLSRKKTKDSRSFQLRDRWEMQMRPTTTTASIPKMIMGESEQQSVLTNGYPLLCWHVLQHVQQ